MAKKMTGEGQFYEELRKAFSLGLFPAPKSPSLMKLLKFYFPKIEDAEVARFLESSGTGGRPKTAAEIASECGQDVKKVESILDGLSGRGGVRKSESMGEPGVIVYSLSGTVGMSDGLGTLGKDDALDPAGITYRDVVNRFYEDGYLQEWGASKYPVFRTLVVDQPIEAESKILPYELASGVIKAHQSIAIAYCNCRVRYRKCDHTINNCFILGAGADRVVKRSREIPGARPVNYASQEEALKVLEESFKEGLVASTVNHTDIENVGWICMCCPCCCHILGGYAINITGWGNPYNTMKSNFQPKVDQAKCRSGCKICVELCPVKARWRHWPHKADLSDDFIFLEEERCIGCGVCAVNCPFDALTMVKVMELTPEPDGISMRNRVNRETRH